jgi:hypothetical protein
MLLDSVILLFGLWPVEVSRVRPGRRDQTIADFNLTLKLTEDTASTALYNRRIAYLRKGAPDLAIAYFTGSWNSAPRMRRPSLVVGLPS